MTVSDLPYVSNIDEMHELDLHLCKLGAMLIGVLLALAGRGQIAEQQLFAAQYLHKVQRMLAGCIHCGDSPWKHQCWYRLLCRQRILGHCFQHDDSSL